MVTLCDGCGGVWTVIVPARHVKRMLEKLLTIAVSNALIRGGKDTLGGGQVAPTHETLYRVLALLL